jgi:hypothetical protein
MDDEPRRKPQGLYAEPPELESRLPDWQLRNAGSEAADATWLPPRHKYDVRGEARLMAMPLAVCVALIVLAADGRIPVLLAVIGVIFFGASMYPITMIRRAENERIVNSHAKGVDVVPTGIALRTFQDPANYVALCRCGWTGAERPRLQDAIDDGSKHAGDAPLRVHQ